jgi:nucleotide-binding universal stress UspA family protein
VSEQKRRPAIKRILVALDASTHSLAALEAAAELAASQHAELIGLFVEDENLINLAGLPFAREVRGPAATQKPIDSAEMEYELRLQASQARRAIREAAERFEARWSFKIVRGHVTGAVLEAALEADLLAMGRVGRTFSVRRRLGSTARAASATGRGSLLLMKGGGHLHYPVLVTYDGSGPAGQALAAAARLAVANQDTLSALLLADSLTQAEQYKAEIVGWLKEHELDPPTEFHWLPGATVTGLVTMVRGAGDCVLVLGGENPLLKASAIQELLDETDCPVMLVR